MEQDPRLDPTEYPELNAVLETLVADARSILAETFCGAYLQGSFAIGEADEHSDVDFVIVTEDAIKDEQLAELQVMHERLYALDTTLGSASGGLLHLERTAAPGRFLPLAVPVSR